MEILQLVFRAMVSSGQLSWTRKSPRSKWKLRMQKPAWQQPMPRHKSQERHMIPLKWCKPRTVQSTVALAETVPATPNNGDRMLWTLIPASQISVFKLKPSPLSRDRDRHPLNNWIELSLLMTHSKWSFLQKSFVSRKSPALQVAVPLHSVSLAVKTKDSLRNSALNSQTPKKSKPKLSLISEPLRTTLTWLRTQKTRACTLINGVLTLKTVSCNLTQRMLSRPNSQFSWLKRTSYRLWRMIKSPSKMPCTLAWTGWPKDKKQDSFLLQKSKPRSTLSMHHGSVFATPKMSLWTLKLSCLLRETKLPNSLENTRWRYLRPLFRIKKNKLMSVTASMTWGPVKPETQLS